MVWGLTLRDPPVHALIFGRRQRGGPVTYNVRPQQQYFQGHETGEADAARHRRRRHIY